MSEGTSGGVGGGPSEVSVTLRGMSLDEELVHYVRMCARQIHGRVCDALLDRRGDRVVVDLQLDRGSRLDALHVHQDDPDPFIAVRNAFCILAWALERRDVAMADAAE